MSKPVGSPYTTSLVATPSSMFAASQPVSNLQKVTNETILKSDIFTLVIPYLTQKEVQLAVKPVCRTWHAVASEASAAPDAIPENAVSAAAVLVPDAIPEKGAKQTHLDRLREDTILDEDVMSMVLPYLSLRDAGVSVARTCRSWDRVYKTADVRKEYLERSMPTAQPISANPADYALALDEQTLFTSNVMAGRFTSRKLPFSRSPVTSCLFPATREEVLIVGLQDGSICMLEMNPLRALHTFDDVSVAITGLLRHQHFLCAQDETGALHVLDLQTKAAMYTLRGETAHAIATVVIPKNFKPETHEGLLTSSSNGLVSLRDIATGQPVVDFRGHTNVITHLYCLEQDGLLITASEDGNLRMWQIATGRCLFNVSIKMHGLFLTNANKLIGVEGNGFCTFDPLLAKMAKPVTAHESPITCVEYAEKEKLLITASQEDQTIKIWDPIKGYLMHTIPFGDDHEGTITTLQLSTSGANVLISGDDQESVILWNLDTKQIIKKIAARSHLIVDLLGNRNDVLLVRTPSGKLKIYDLSNGKELYALSGDLPSVTLMMGLDGLRRLVAFSGEKGELGIVDFNGRQPERSHLPPKDKVDPSLDTLT